MNKCCKLFFDSEGLQGILNEPMQYCPYCGRRLTGKEWRYYNNRLGKIDETGREINIVRPRITAPA